MRLPSITVDLFATKRREEDMGAWDSLVGIFEPVALGILLIALGWAARERGRVHHHLTHQRPVRLTRPAAQIGSRSSTER
jgi:hypothetical protein